MPDDDNAPSLIDITKFNWGRRALQKDQPFIQNLDGTISTHRMAAEKDDSGNWWAFPTIVQSDKGTLHQFDNHFDAMRWNIDRGEAVDFGNDGKSAQRFAEGQYKIGTPLEERGYQKGGEVSRSKYMHGTDTVDAKLTPKEAVLNRNAAELAGRDYIRHLNRMGNELASRGVDLAAAGAEKRRARVMNEPGGYQRGIADVLGPLLLAATGITSVKYPAPPPKSPPLYKLPKTPPQKPVHFPKTAPARFQEGTADVITDPNDPRLSINQGRPGGSQEQPAPQSSSSSFDANREAVYRGLRDLGFPQHVTAALLGDAQQESGFRPNLVGDNRTSFGLWQVGSPLFHMADRDARALGLQPGTPGYAYHQTQFIGNYYRQHNPEQFQAMVSAPDAASALKEFRSTPGWDAGTTGRRFELSQAYERSLPNMPGLQLQAYKTEPYSFGDAMAPLTQPTGPGQPGPDLGAGMTGQQATQAQADAKKQATQDQQKKSALDAISQVAQGFQQAGKDMSAAAKASLATPVNASLQASINDPLAPLRIIQPYQPIRPWGM
jgi:hypothetical protein